MWVKEIKYNKINFFVQIKYFVLRKYGLSDIMK